MPKVRRFLQVARTTDTPSFQTWTLRGHKLPERFRRDVAHFFQLRQGFVQLVALVF